MTNSGKEPSAKQLAAREKFAQAARNRSAANKQLSDPTTPLSAPEAVTDVQDKTDITQMQKQIDEIMETNALLKAALLGRQQQGNSRDNVAVGRNNNLVGEVDKYLVDQDNYPDPTARLASEPRLAPLAFQYNYELDYAFSIRSYETKTGLNMREPEFLIRLNRIVLDEQGEQTSKRYIARRLMFHEDSQAALVIARENNIQLDPSDERTFLNEMRYLRVRDWLFDIFWPKPAQSAGQIKEEVIGGQLVQVFTKSSEDSSEIDFNKIGDSKLRV